MALIYFLSVGSSSGASLSNNAAPPPKQPLEETLKPAVADKVKSIKVRLDTNLGVAEKRTLLNEGLQIAHQSQDVDSILYFLRRRFDLFKDIPTIKKEREDGVILMCVQNKHYRHY